MATSVVVRVTTGVTAVLLSTALVSAARQSTAGSTVAHNTDATTSTHHRGANDHGDHGDGVIGWD